MAGTLVIMRLFDKNENSGRSLKNKGNIKHGLRPHTLFTSLSGSQSCHSPLDRLIHHMKYNERSNLLSPSILLIKTDGFLYKSIFRRKHLRLEETKQMLYSSVVAEDKNEKFRWKTANRNGKQHCYSLEFGLVWYRGNRKFELVYYICFIIMNINLAFSIIGISILT